MSARLLRRAYAAKVGSHAEKLVLLKLVDAAEDDGTRIFPAVETIGNDIGCHKRTVQRLLKKFVDCGLLTIVRGGGRGPGSTTEYCLNLDVLDALGERGWDKRVARDRIRVTATPPLRDDKGGADDTGRVAPDADKGGQACHPTPYDPLNTPSSGREDSSKGDRRKPQPRRKPAARDPDDDLFDKALRQWPTSAADGPEAARFAWSSLTPEERAAAVERIPAYLDNCNSKGRTRLCGLARYLSEKRFQLLTAASGQASGMALVPARSRDWWTVFWRRHAKGDRGIRAMLALAHDGTPWGVPADQYPTAEEATRLVEVPWDSPPCRAWKFLLSRERLFLDYRCGPSIWVPTEWPPQHEPKGVGGGVLEAQS